VPHPRGLNEPAAAPRARPCLTRSFLGAVDTLLMTTRGVSIEIGG
jgi:hypothetical protein